jgi:hypothetical protein
MKRDERETKKDVARRNTKRPGEIRRHEKRKGGSERKS